ncbi:hypothetical protein EV1_000178 [Malus domestica]
MEANPILFQRSLRRQTHFAPELFNDKVNSAPRHRTPRLPLAVAHLALPRRRTPYENSNQWERGVGWQGGEGKGRSEATKKGVRVDFFSSNQLLVSVIERALMSDYRDLWVGRVISGIASKRVILKCIFSSLPSTRPFGSSLASGSVGTPKLSEKKAISTLLWAIRATTLLLFLVQGAITPLKK